MFKNGRKQVKTNKYAKVRAQMKEYGLPLQTVMCGKLYNKKYFLTNRTAKTL